jgi:hypothetical protein
MDTMIVNGFRPDLASAEHSFTNCQGYGGKVDYHEDRIADFKSKDVIDTKKQYAYSEHMMQLAAYREGLGKPKSECWNFFVGADDAAVLPYHWSEEDLERGLKMFHCLLKYWKLDKKYDPSWVTFI